MEMTIKAVQNKEMSIRKASQSFGVPKDSLHRRVTNKLKTISSDKPETKLLGAYRKVLNDGQEKELYLFHNLKRNRANEKANNRKF